MKKTFDKISMEKQEVTPVKTIPELPGFNVYYQLSLIDTDCVAYFVPISTTAQEENNLTLVSFYHCLKQLSQRLS